MKFNWKILVAVVVIAGVIFWGVDSLQARSYSGKDVNFPVGGGVITINNTADTAIPAQLVGTGSRSFSIVKSTMDTTGSSVREGNGSSATQTFDFELPAGVSEFSIARGDTVSFIASSDATISATVQQLSAENTQSTLILMVVVVAIALYFISSALEHSWIKRLRGTNTPAQDTETVTSTKATSQGGDLRSFGDNRS